MNLDAEALGKRVYEILLSYVGARSDTDSQLEANIDGFFQNWIKGVPYFNDHPDHYGLYPIPNDDLGRNVCWCLRKGAGDDTIVMIHHSDCVETSDYSGLEPMCLEPENLARAYREHGEELPPEIDADLASGEWIFGRGVSDMKGGGSVEYALMEEYCRNESFNGNVLVMSLPDEENLSAGMRGACFLLDDLKKRFNLKYILMINTEPHERDTPNAPSLYDGSVGKIMPVIYVRGKMAHVGQVYSGLNPINLLAEIVRRTELNPYFIEKSGTTVSPPATWLYSKDRKTVYDVTLPMDAVGYMSVLPLERSVQELMDMVKDTCGKAFDAVIDDMNTSYEQFLRASGLPAKKLPFKTNVKFFEELYKDALRDSGECFTTAYAEAYADVRQKWKNKEIAIIDGVNQLIATTLKHVKDPWPMIIVALAPPYYPSVNNKFLSGEKVKRAQAAIEDVMLFAKENFNQNYSMRNYYTGISDLSYAMYEGSERSIEYVKSNMLLWGTIYEIPLDLIKENAMPMVNIGPWGKDFHKYTERVLKSDLLRVTPAMVNRVVCTMLKN